MIFIYPAAGIGIVVVFILGAAFARTILERITQKQSDPTKYYRNRWEEVKPAFPLTEKRINFFSILAGVIAVVLLILLFAFLPTGWAIGAFLALTVLGILFALLTLLS